MADLGQEILAAVQKAFTNKAKTDIVIADLQKKLSESGVSYREAEEYAARIGELLSRALKENITAEILPGGKMPLELAEEILRPLLTQNYDEASRVAAQVQQSLNRRAGLGMNALQPEVNEDRATGIIEKISSYDSYEEASWLTGEPVVNYTQSAVEDTIRKNADAHFKAGLSPKIKRIATGGCCKWCRSLAGTYDYPVDRDVYRRHESCRCLVLYDPRDGGKVQNAHTKREYETKKAAIDAHEKERRKTLVNNYLAREKQLAAGRKEIRRRISDGEYSLKLKEQKYLQHIQGTAQFERTVQDRGRPQSYLTISKDEVQELINRYSGLGDMDFYEDGTPMDVEFFSTGFTVGYYFKDGEYQPTDRLAICHAKKGSHVYPVDPKGRRK